MAGNRLQEQVMIDNTGTPVITTTNWTYNNANQIATMQVGSNPVSNFQYDANGNLTSDGQLAYTWDRANRLTTLNNGSYNTHYAYDGNSNRVQQTIGGIATDYLLDIQPQLALVLKETTPTKTLSYVHNPKGVHAVEDNTGDWHFMVNDGLGSVRSQVDDLAQVEASQAYSPYGQVYGVEGTFTGSFGYTGEQVDESGMSYLRARYYDPSQATFASLDPFEGVDSMPMSLNGYAYVHGNPIMNTDPTGMMVAGRRVNIDMSGTSRILQSWSNTLKNAFTIPSLSLVKSMNSGMCGGGRVGNVGKPDGRFYSRGGGSDIRQDDSWGDEITQNNSLTINPSDICNTNLLVHARQAIGIRHDDDSLDYLIVNLKAECLLQDRSITDLERLASLSDFVADGGVLDKNAYMSLMTYTLIGSNSGSLAAVNSVINGGCAGIGREPKDCPQNMSYFLDTGFHPDFQDGHNQVYHFWGMVGSIAIDTNLISFSLSTMTNVIGFQVVHEGIQGVMCNLGLYGGDAGSSWQDYALTDAAIWLGIGLARDQIQPVQVGAWIRHFLGESGAGWSILGVRPQDLQESPLALPGGFDAVCN